MPLLFKMQKTQVTFNLTLIFKVRILDILKLFEKRERVLEITKLFRNAERSEK